ncbi:glycoside hydrolase family 16 protein [Flavivirga spongiicola]|uniref:Glycoside hydrolase family 16 protein n=1 Tax=Flavivirga spongiicola TaxID=421621 RepID=A0ABU7XNF8_9FLAO|nr:glycoside hydrolase family 16 protein [Flavivirga sp. MEBiC05379]MDO5977302.1 glycoside hydrolase family 16 protein [Flavivirga sp. MEBiC05379]
MKTKSIIVVAILFIAACTKSNVIPENNEEPKIDSTSYSLIFEDNFNGSSINNSNWTVVFSGGSNWNNTAVDEPQVVEVSNGTLKLKGIKNPNFTGNLANVQNINRSTVWTGAIESAHKVDFTYGIVEIRARVEKAPRVWPAIWLHATDNVYGGNPDSGEIDMLESLNLDSYFYSTIHTQYHWANNRQYSNDPERYTTKTVNVDSWNVYKLEWTPNKIDFIFNGSVYHTFNKGNNNVVSGFLRWPFDKDFHIILSQQIGGGWVDSEANSKGLVLTESNLPVTMEIDYVKVYQKKQN